jgi:predicted neuraminidase
VKAKTGSFRNASSAAEARDAEEARAVAKVRSASKVRTGGNGEFVFSKAPFASCHASTIVELRDGSLMSAWFAGSAEGNPDVAIWGSRRTPAGWARPVELVRESGIACYNPVLFHAADDRLWLYYKFGAHPVSWTAGRLWSDDDGKSWSPVEHLPAGLYGPVRTKPLVMNDGAIVSGTSVETYRSWACWIERSTDGGQIWTKAGPITVRADGVAPAAGHEPPEVPGSEEWKYTDGIIQPSVVSMGGQWLRLYARSTARTGRVCVADSSDGGVTWTQAHPIDVPNPNSGIDAVALRDGRVVLIYNHTASGRSPLNLAVSEDGEHFQMFEALETQPGEYSYPAIIQGRQGDLHITYTWNRQRMRYVRFPLGSVPKGSK